MIKMKKEKKNMQSNKMNRTSRACDNKKINARTKNTVTDKSIGFDDDNQGE